MPRGLGCVARDSVGSALGVCVGNAFEAESRALLLGMQLAMALSCSKLVFETESVPFWMSGTSSP